MIGKIIWGCFGLLMGSIVTAGIMIVPFDRIASEFEAEIARLKKELRTLRGES